MNRKHSTFNIQHRTLNLCFGQALMIGCWVLNVEC
jgi:hypothetical protein